ncbi:MAG: hypothetical protein ACPGJW_11610, partial [Paracoccaceae bacterium]
AVGERIITDGGPITFVYGNGKPFVLSLDNTAELIFQMLKRLCARFQISHQSCLGPEKLNTLNKT